MCLISTALMAVGARTSLMAPVRHGLGTILDPIVRVAQWPYWMVERTRLIVLDRTDLLARLEFLERRNLELAQKAMQMEALRSDNARMKALHDSMKRIDSQVPQDALMAEVVGLTPVSSIHEVVIDKGAAHGLQVGHAVLDADGLVGQVTEVTQINARVLLITDARHGLPVETLRNGVRAVASGTGQLDKLQLEGLPLTADIRAGDKLIASGLGGRFPYGYPVGEVLAVRPDPSHVFALVSARPSARLRRARHLLVIRRNPLEIPQ